jgi:menaquinone-9 beta-reductase
MRGRCDVAVVGAGPGGSAAAHYLAQGGLAVTLVDRAAFPRDKTCGDGLTPRAVAILHDMGVLPALLSAGQPISAVDVFAPGGHATAASISPVAGAPVPMLVVPRLTLDDLVRRRAMHSGAHFEGQVWVTGLQQTGGGVTVHGSGPEGHVAIAARAAVIATGAATALPASLGLVPAAPRRMLAGRAYYARTAGPAERIQLRFDDVPLPGYGWLFPTSATSANVGVGYFPSASGARRRPQTTKAAFDRFVAARGMAPRIGGARRLGPMRGYPLRTDFPDVRTFGDRVLLVGEAAGLVNPLTGEGIDYALESGQLAADVLTGAFRGAGLTQAALAGYDRGLRARFERLFTLCRRVREVSMHPVLLNRLVRLAARRDDLQRMLVDVVLGNREIADRLTAGAIVRKALALIR